MENKNYSLNEMMVHVPLCTHAEPSKVLLVGETDEDMIKEIEKHNVELKCVDSLQSENEKIYDVIIYLNDDIDETLMANVERIINDKGIFTCKSEMAEKSLDKLKSDITTVGKNFWITMPYRFGHNSLILASKKYHPQADIVLQKSDLLDDLNYYSTEMQNSCFVYPANLHRELTGIAKR